MRFITIIALAAFGALAAGAGDAEAQYPARCTGLSDAVKAIPGLTQADRDNLNKAITDYCIKRAACLVEVRAALQKKTDVKVDGAWPACVSSPPLEALDRGVAAISEENRSKPAGNEVVALVQQEAQFWQLLNGALKSVALSRDDVATAAVDVAREVVTVRDREWPAVQVYGERFCRELAEGMRYRLYQTGLDKTRDGIARWREVIAEWSNSQAEASSSSWQRALVSLEVLMTSFNHARSSSNQRRGMDAAMSGGGATSSMYWNLRYRTADFISRSRGREDKLRDAVNALDTFVGNLRAPGQAADAKVLADLLKVELDRVRGEYVAVLTELANHHDNQVVKLRTTVMCEEQWRALVSKFVNENTRREIAEFRASLKTSFSGSMRDEVEKRLGSAIRQADAALEQEDREQQADQRLAEDGLSKSTR